VAGFGEEGVGDAGVDDLDVITTKINQEKHYIHLLPYPKISIFFAKKTQI